MVERSTLDQSTSKEILTQLSRDEKAAKGLWGIAKIERVSALHLSFSDHPQLAQTGSLLPSPSIPFYEEMRGRFDEQKLPLFSSSNPHQPTLAWDLKGSAEEGVVQSMNPSSAWQWTETQASLRLSGIKPIRGKEHLFAGLGVPPHWNEHTLLWKLSWEESPHKPLRSLSLSLASTFRLIAFELYQEGKQGEVSFLVSCDQKGNCYLHICQNRTSHVCYPLSTIKTGTPKHPSCWIHNELYTRFHPPSRQLFLYSIAHRTGEMLTFADEREKGFVLKEQRTATPPNEFGMGVGSIYDLSEIVIDNQLFLVGHALRGNHHCHHPNFPGKNGFCLWAPFSKKELFLKMLDGWGHFHSLFSWSAGEKKIHAILNVRCSHCYQGPYRYTIDFFEKEQWIANWKLLLSENSSIKGFSFLSFKKSPHFLLEVEKEKEKREFLFYRIFLQEEEMDLERCVELLSIADV